MKIERKNAVGMQQRCVENIFVNKNKYNYAFSQKGDPVFRFAKYLIFAKEQK